MTEPTKYPMPTIELDPGAYEELTTFIEVLNGTLLPCVGLEGKATASNVILHMISYYMEEDPDDHQWLESYMENLKKGVY